jgi:hypothetical protein
MEAWLSAHALNPIARPVWVPEVPVRSEGSVPPPPPSSPGTEHATREDAATAAPAARRGKSVETLRKNLRDIADSLGPRDLDTLTAFAEFLKARRAARAFAHHLHDAHDPSAPAEEEAPTSQEIASPEAHSA